MKIFAEDRHKKIIRDILSKYPYSFYAFGSRAIGNPNKFSDLDLCYFDDIPWKELSQLEEDFQESDLPFTVDLVNWNKCSDTFKGIIKDDLVWIGI
jgi:predicted nucleotidyltransferase